MNRTKLSVMAVLLTGIVVFLSLNSPTLAVVGDASTGTQTPSSTTTDTTVDLDLLVLVDRLELSPTQMRQGHDLLAGVLDVATSLQADRKSFAQELIRFNGIEKELDALVAGFDARATKKLASLRESANKALDELKDILTVRQGEILREGLGPSIVSRGSLLGAGRLGAEGGLRGMLGQTRGLGQGALDQNPLLERLRGFLANHPDLKNELLGALRGSGNTQRGETPAPPAGRTDRRGTDVAPQFLRGQALAQTDLGKNAIARLEELVKILELKLQYLE
jgi:hypothetical protein